MEKTTRRNRLVQYVIDSYHELTKVTWPTKIQAINICVLVVSFVFVAAVVFAGVDYLFNRGYNYLLDLPVVSAPASDAVVSGASAVTDGNGTATIETEPVTAAPITVTPEATK